MDKINRAEWIELSLLQRSNNVGDVTWNNWYTDLQLSCIPSINVRLDLPLARGHDTSLLIWSNP